MGRLLLRMFEVITIYFAGILEYPHHAKLVKKYLRCSSFSNITSLKRML